MSRHTYVLNPWSLQFVAMLAFVPSLVLLTVALAISVMRLSQSGNKKRRLLPPPEEPPAPQPTLVPVRSVPPPVPLSSTSAGGGVMLLYASPLCYMGQTRSPVAMPQIPIEKEWEVLAQVEKEATGTDLQPWCGRSLWQKRSGAVLLAQPLTVSALQHAIAPASTAGGVTVLHLSAHGVDGSLVLEDGKGTAQLLSSEMLREMLNLRAEMHNSLQGRLRLVFLNACSLYGLASQMVQSGIPHVICSSAELRDDASHMFLRTFYTSIFQGRTVALAFRAALVALRTAPSEATRAAANCFHLLPEGEAHAEVLFQPAPSSSRSSPQRASSSSGAQLASEASARSCSTASTRTLPLMPEDFLGRTVDVWTVLQHLSARRIVAICGGAGTDNGIGKSVVLDAVHRAFMLQVGGISLTVRPKPRTRLNIHGWIAQVHSSIRASLQEFLDQSAPGGAAASEGASDDEFATVDLEQVACAQNQLVDDMLLLAECCESQRREWPSVCGQILLILDECDDFIQQPHFHDTIAHILRNCPMYRILLGAHKPVVGAGSGYFKIVHHPLLGLSPKEAARLFLSRAQRPVRWEELFAVPNGDGTAAGPNMVGNTAGARRDLSAPVMLNKSNDAEVLALVATHPCVAAQQGNPRRLVELASRVVPSLAHLRDLCPSDLTSQAPAQSPQQWVLPDQPRGLIRASTAPAPGPAA